MNKINIIVLVAAGLTGCVSSGTYNKNVAACNENFREIVENFKAQQKLNISIAAALSRKSVQEVEEELQDAAARRQMSMPGQ